MATTETKKSTTAAKSAKAQAAEETTEREVLIPKEIDPSQYVGVRNGFQGMLIYKSPKTGEIYTWDSYGDELEMELRELRNAKTSSKAFFINNWFMFDEEWIVDYLGVRQYYKNAIRPEDFDKIFDKSPAELKKAIAGMPDGLKRSVAYRASQLIGEGGIDSRKTIAALEEALGIALIEK